MYFTGSPGREILRKFAKKKGKGGGCPTRIYSLIGTVRVRGGRSSIQEEKKS